ncbi:MAG TPA: hypothetical protein VMG39_10505, partial [Pseudolabrys sp.]|nr:hypothetical protein [Pseudolabrys sp.]
TNQTYERYNDEAALTINQFIHESDRDDLPDLDTPDLTIAATQWVLDQRDRWAKSYVTLKCLAMAQRVHVLTVCGLIPDASGEKLLHALKAERPRPAGTTDAMHPKKREQQKPSRTVRNRILRKVIASLCGDDDEFNMWIAGLLRIGSRNGWRPCELFGMRLDGNVLSGPAEKFSRVDTEGTENTEVSKKKIGGPRDRGLFERLEIVVGERYPKKIIAALRAWTTRAPHWLEVYGGSQALLAAIRERIRRACEGEGVKLFSPYALRHFAIASMKRSGRGKAEIAAIVNHLSDRTAGENYGRGTSGIRRPRAMFSVAPARIAEVRKSKRSFAESRVRRERGRKPVQ